MSVLVLKVGNDLHRRQRSTAARETVCSCGRFRTSEGGSSQQANEWRAHVDGEAAALHVAVEKPEFGNAFREVLPRQVACMTCGWQGLRDTPHAGYKGPAGPCPKCGNRTRAVG